jgi:hypothetical protein
LLSQADLDGVTEAGVSRRDLCNALYINFGFNLINRIADAFGFRGAGAAGLHRAASGLLRFGYLPLCGVIGLRAPELGGGDDPYRPLVTDLQNGAVFGDGVLPSAIRAQLVAGSAPGLLGQYASVVRDNPTALTDESMRALLREGVSEAAIFEATICAALGAAFDRLDPALELAGLTPARTVKQ